MLSTNAIVVNILNLDENEFFSADQSVLGPRESQLLDLDFFGVAVNAPAQIETSSRDKLPLIMATKYSGDRGWEVGLRDNCILVATNLQDGTVKFAKTFVSEKALRSRGRLEEVPKGPKPQGLALEAVQMSELNPKGRLQLKWDSGTWALGVIYYDWPSNTVEVELQGDEDAISSPAKPVSPDPDPRGAQFLPYYMSTAKTPGFSESGLTFTGELKMKEGKQQLNIFGSFSVNVRGFHLPAQKLVHKFLDGRQESVAAVVPVTLAVLGLDWDEPLQFDWAVPVYGEALAIGMPARGCFGIDALANGKVLGPGKYLCYIVMDGKIIGPKTLQVN